MKLLINFLPLLLIILYYFETFLCLKIYIYTGHLDNQKPQLERMQKGFGRFLVYLSKYNLQTEQFEGLTENPFFSMKCTSYFVDMVEMMFDDIKYNDLKNQIESGIGVQFQVKIRPNNFREMEPLNIVIDDLEKSILIHLRKGDDDDDGNVKFTGEVVDDDSFIKRIVTAAEGREDWLNRKPNYPPSKKNKLHEGSSSSIPLRIEEPTIDAHDLTHLLREEQAPDIDELLATHQSDPTHAAASPHSTQNQPHDGLQPSQGDFSHSNAVLHTVLRQLQHSRSGNLLPDVTLDTHQIGPTQAAASSHSTRNEPHDGKLQGESSNPRKRKSPDHDKSQ